MNPLRCVNEDWLRVLGVKAFAVYECQKVVFELEAGLRLIPFARLAADEALFQQAQWRIGEEIQILVQIGDLPRLQDAIVIYCLSDQLRRIGHTHRQQLEIVVANFRISSEWIAARDDQTAPLAVGTGRLEIVAAQLCLGKEACGILRVRPAVMKTVAR